MANQQVAPVGEADEAGGGARMPRTNRRRATFAPAQNRKSERRAVSNRNIVTAEARAAGLAPGSRENSAGTSSTSACVRSGNSSANCSADGIPGLPGFGEKGDGLLLGAYEHL